ncbi:MAG: sugar phosphate isomerase/epimerase [Armatimonadetes bacterium]|jgi:sugar phosphate isomerase/epimerase|nr:sugar phosphate isomerase/epimerase [Armatimonadota bacterium]
MKLGFIGANDLPGVEADAQFAAEHGFVGLEYNYWGDFRNLTAGTVREMRAILDRHGVRASALGLWGWNHLAPDAAERAEAHEMLSRAIEFAMTLGAEVLITGGGDLPGAPLAEKVAEFGKVFPPFLERAAAAGLTVAMYAVHGNSFFDCMEAYERVWERFPQIGIKFDPANWRHHGDDYLKILRDHGDRIAYVHIKEHLYLDGELVSQPAAGMGDIAWGKIFAFLHESDYQGYLSIEPHGPIWSQGAMREKMLLLSKRYISQFLL